MVYVKKDKLSQMWRWAKHFAGLDFYGVRNFAHLFVGKRLK